MCYIPPLAWFNLNHWLLKHRIHSNVTGKVECGCSGPVFGQKDMTSYIPDSAGTRRSSNASTFKEGASTPGQRRESGASVGSGGSGREWRSSRWMLDKVLAHRHNVSKFRPFLPLILITFYTSRIIARHRLLIDFI